ncbi:MAG: DUF4251 domain-containing protein [Dysgonamonadaceae bacterium]|jgi:hypothetical protein|nr:DUF4251 domain-containing protein [Dysgonamonadaceae bacterium]
MKKILKIALALSIVVLIVSACGTKQTAAEKAAIAAGIAQQVEDQNFTFEADYVYPTGYKSMYLSPFYDVKVSKDTVDAYLPYFGRVYVAPTNPLEGGIQFLSKDFDYKVTKGKKADKWLVDIKINDAGRQLLLQFEIWENGNTRLFVQDFNRQPISFSGRIADEKEK